MKKSLRIIGWVLVSALLLAEAGLLLSGKGYVNKVVWMTLLHGKTSPDIYELDLFPTHVVAQAIPQPWPVSVHYGKLNIPDSLVEFMHLYQTASFLVIHQDSVLYEWVANEGRDLTNLNSFSMAKSITSMLIGCAVKDGLIASIDDPVGKYIPEFNEGTKQEITIRHLLTMSSGLGYEEGYGSPFSWPAEAYYGSDVNAITLRVEVAEKPGREWLYKGGDTQLLGIILHKVLGGQSIASYAAERVWKRIGAEHPAYWSTDEQGMEKVSCCFYSNARDFAKLAKLYLHDGRWNAEQIVDSAWVAQSLQPANNVMKHGKPVSDYGFQWWLLQHRGHSVFYMRGIRGQYILAVPDRDLIIVRLGNRRAAKTGDDLPSDIFTYLDAGIGLTEHE